MDEINAHLESQGLRLREGTIVDATIIEAPPSSPVFPIWLKQVMR